jgi:G6PDH family F420-dependent oxidoreductase
VTCPTVRVHPAIVAQAAATSAVLHQDRFVLGVGSGEALNEQVLGDPWPLTDERLAMLEEAIEVMRALWTGEVVSHHGRHYTVEHARLYTRPDTPPRVYVSGFGPKSIELAGRVGDGYITTKPDADAVKAFRAAGGEGKPVQGGTKVCWSPDAAEARRTVHRIWPNSGLPGELSQVLRTPEHFMQASSIVTEDMAAETAVCGPDVAAHVAKLQEYVDAGFDEVYVNQIGPQQEGFFEFYAREVLPRLRPAGPTG